jgi:hypothetical protein
MSVVRNISAVDIIDIVWDGPFSMEEVERDASGPKDFGVYQIYGSHGSGTDQLLYIGRATDATFSKRVASHHEWTDWEPKSVEVYLGRLGGVNKLPATHSAMTEWGNWICRAEAILIYFSSPPFNSSGIRGTTHLSGSPVIVLNFNRRHRLCATISSLYENSPATQSNHGWEPFLEPDHLLNEPVPQAEPT